MNQAPNVPISKATGNEIPKQIQPDTGHMIVSNHDTLNMNIANHDDQ